jgi:hypothetical protein
MVRRFLIMLPVISTLLAFVAGFFRSRASLCLEHLVLRHQLAVYQQTVDRPRLRSTDRVLWAWLSRLWPGWLDAPAFVQPRAAMTARQRRKAWWYAHTLYELMTSMAAQAELPAPYVPRLDEDPVVAAAVARQALGLAPDRPIGPLIRMLERGGRRHAGDRGHRDPGG